MGDLLASPDHGAARPPGDGSLLQLEEAMAVSIYGDLSKAQRAMLAALFSRIREESAVSIDAALCSSSVRASGKEMQTARNLAAKGLVRFESRYGAWSAWVYLTPAGLKLMRSLDFRHARGRG